MRSMLEMSKSSSTTRILPLAIVASVGECLSGGPRRDVQGHQRRLHHLPGIVANEHEALLEVQKGIVRAHFGVEALRQALGERGHVRGLRQNEKVVVRGVA